MMRPIVFAAATLLASQPLSAQIFADFETSLGNFTCQLNHAGAPKTVANFITLAEGTRPWADPTGAVRTNVRFYDGLIFHRVVAGFVNQAGCPLGTGTSGPGYRFPDETQNGVNVEPYVISMANSGSYTNGSQFFVTVPRPSPLNFLHLNGNHTVFGTVTSGSAVVDLINAVPTDSNGKPLAPVILQSVVIRRVGTEAIAFDALAQNLPVVSTQGYDVLPHLPTSIEAIPRTPRPGNTTTATYASEDLLNWELASSDYHGLGPADPDPFQIAIRYGFATYPEKEFYRFVDIVNPDGIVPESLAGKTLSVFWPGNSLVFSFDSTGTGGTATLNGEATPRAITTIYETQSPYDWIIEAAGLLPLKISASLTDSAPTLNSGSHKLLAWNGSWSLVGHGSLTITR